MTFSSGGEEEFCLVSVDNLAGLSEALAAAFPRARIQKCVVHQVRNVLRYVPWKDRKAVARDLHTIYTAPTEAAGRAQLETFAHTWDAPYPYIAKSWRANWVALATFYQYSAPLRELIYTTNPIENVHWQLRKITKTRGVFPPEDAVLKFLYLGVHAQEVKWTQRRKN